jgi:hypothetical protein
MFGGFPNARRRGRDLVEWLFVLTAAAYNFIRIPSDFGSCRMIPPGMWEMLHLEK